MCIVKHAPGGQLMAELAELAMLSCGLPTADAAPKALRGCSPALAGRWPPPKVDRENLLAGTGAVSGAEVARVSCDAADAPGSTLVLRRPPSSDEESGAALLILAILLMRLQQTRTAIVRSSAANTCMSGTATGLLAQLPLAELGQHCYR